jgi:hypothetical protein
MKQANTNYYLIVRSGSPVRVVFGITVEEMRQATYLASDNTFTSDRSQAMRLSEADRDAMLERFPTCFACVA